MWRLLGLCAAALLLGALWLKTPTKGNTPLYVAAAASLKPALDSFIKTYDVEILPVYASSGTLARQAQQGAPFDLIVLAQPVWFEALAQTVPFEAQTILAENRLVFVSRQELSAWPIDAEQVTGRIAIGDPAFVPVGSYAQEALYAAELWEPLSEQLVYGSDARAVMTFFLREEVSAAFVYESDWKQAVKAQLLRGDAFALTVPVETSVVYPMALRKGASVEARALFEALSGAHDFERFGFITP